MTVYKHRYSKGKSWRDLLFPLLALIFAVKAFPFADGLHTVPSGFGTMVNSFATGVWVAVAYILREETRLEVELCGEEDSIVIESEDRWGPAAAGVSRKRRIGVLFLFVGTVFLTFNVLAYVRSECYRIWVHQIALENLPGQERKQYHFDKWESASKARIANLRKLAANNRFLQLVVAEAQVEYATQSIKNAGEVHPFLKALNETRSDE